MDPDGVSNKAWFLMQNMSTPSPQSTYQSKIATKEGGGVGSRAVLNQKKIPSQAQM